MFVERIVGWKNKNTTKVGNIEGEEVTVKDFTFEAHYGMGSEGRGKVQYLMIDPTSFTEEKCAILCGEMPRCSGFTFRIDAENKTLAGQCRFKEKINVVFPQENRNTYLKKLPAPPAVTDEVPTDYPELIDAADADDALL